jgi:hypothetical protein
MSIDVLDHKVAATFKAYPKDVQAKLLALRALVLQTAKDNPAIGVLEESLKWGEPAYRPINGAGTTVRMDWKAKHPTVIALFFNCKTTLIDEFRAQYGALLRFEGQRAILFARDEAIDEAIVAMCIERALTYHLR